MSVTALDHETKYPASRKIKGPLLAGKKRRAFQNYKVCEKMHECLNALFLLLISKFRCTNAVVFVVVLLRWRRHVGVRNTYCCFFRARSEELIHINVNY